MKATPSYIIKHLTYVAGDGALLPSSASDYSLQTFYVLCHSLLPWFYHDDGEDDDDDHHHHHKWIIHMLKFHATFWCQSSGFFLCLIFIPSCYLLSLNFIHFFSFCLNVYLPLVLRSGRETNFRTCWKEKVNLPYSFPYFNDEDF
jgi:hypothetical protein